MATGPTFLNPPVAEVICGLQFQDLPNWSSAQFGRFWATIASEYPISHDQLPLLKLIADDHPRPSDLRSVFEVPPLRRVFFQESDGRHLIQLQMDRFLFNWKKIGSDKYPRFNSIYHRFDAAWKQFTSFLETQKIEEPILEMWELTYVNHITATELSFPADASKFLSFYQRNPEAITAKDAEGKLLQAANMFLHFDWKLPDNAGTLTLEAKHGIRAGDQNQVLILELTSRGKVPSLETDLASRFQIGHDAIVNTFAKLTTDQGHEIWERKE